MSKNSVNLNTSLEPKTSFSERTLNNLFSIILVALFVSILQIILYYFFIIPYLNTSITTGINNVSINDMNINNIIDKILIQILYNDKIFSSIENHIKNVIIDEVKDELIKNELVKNEFVKNGLVINEPVKNGQVKNGLYNEDINDYIFNEDDDGDISYISKTNFSKVNSGKLKLEHFEQNNQRKYYIDEDMKTISDIFIEVLKNNNFDVNDKTSKYIEMLIKKDFNLYINNILNTINYEEKRIININNDSTKIISAFIILILLILLIFIYYLINSNNNRNGVKFEVYVTSFIIILCIMLFQVNFYFFIKEYKYLGNEGNEEVIAHIFKHLGI